MDSYFARCATVAEVKSEYRRLAMLHHPDRGGDTATMQAVNAAYHDALKRMDGQTTNGTDNKPHTYRYDAQRESEIAAALAKILAIKMTATVALIGNWIWVTGDTKPVKEELKALGCCWHAKRVAWYWRPEEQKYMHRYASHADLGDLAAVYGYKIFNTSADAEASALAA